MDMPGYMVECFDTTDTAKNQVHLIPGTFFMIQSINDFTFSLEKRKASSGPGENQVLMLVLRGQTTEVMHERAYSRRQTSRQVLKQTQL